MKIYLPGKDISWFRAGGSGAGQGFLAFFYFKLASLRPKLTNRSENLKRYP